MVAAAADLERHGAGLARALEAQRGVAEAMAVARRLGDQVVLVGTSTGGSLATIAAFDPAWLPGGLRDRVRAGWGALTGGGARRALFG